MKFLWGTMQQSSCLIKMRILMVFLLIIFALPFFSAAHYVVGVVDDAFDGREANDLEVVLWNPSNGIHDNLTDVVGVNGNAAQDNFYLIDCEGLNSPCNIGDTINVKVFSYPFSVEISVLITGAGFDLAENLTLNSVPHFLSVLVDDSFRSPIFPDEEVDLLAGSNNTIFCEAVVEDLDSDSLQNIYSEFFDSSNSFFGDADNFTSHYTNNSCVLNSTYWNNQSLINCSFEVLYSADYGEWNCTIYVEDNFSSSDRGSDVTNVNQLLSLGMQDSINFSTDVLGVVSPESSLVINNLGNVPVNLSLSGSPMNCSVGQISTGYVKYNLSNSIPGILNLEEFELNYANLTNSVLTREFNLPVGGMKSTYWRVYVPFGIVGDCSGDITLGAYVG